MTTVAITQDDRIEDALTGALGHFRLETLIRGRIVAVKPNDTYASSTDTTGVTQPDTLRAVIRYLKQFSPKQLIVSGGAGAAETDEVFEVAGLMEVIKQEEVEFFDHNRPPFEKIPLEYQPEKGIDGPQKSVMVNRRVLEYEVLIALNQLKLHHYATVTLALKNIAMSYPAADYYGHPRSRQFHTHHFFENLHSFIAAMAWRFPSDLAVTVGHPAMIGTGPLGGVAVETGLAVVSDDPLAADVVGARLLGFRLQAVRHLWEANLIGLGEADPARMKFPGMHLSQAIEAFARRAYPAGND